jgi:hypothetical protein
MAKLTLPHPNKDFVPLAPLTAQELDEMVANTKAVADFTNGLASGKNIDNNSIEPGKLKQPNVQIIQSGNLATQYKTQQVRTQWFDQTYWNANFFRQRNEKTRIEFSKAFKNPPAVAVQILNAGINPLTVFSTVVTTTYVEFTIASLTRISQELDVTVSVIATGELA